MPVRTRAPDFNTTQSARIFQPAIRLSSAAAGLITRSYRPGDRRWSLTLTPPEQGFTVSFCPFPMFARGDNGRCELRIRPGRGLDGAGRSPKTLPLGPPPTIRQVSLTSNLQREIELFLAKPIERKHCPDRGNLLHPCRSFHAQSHKNLFTICYSIRPCRELLPGSL